jgi:hypothetical protein
MKKAIVCLLIAFIAVLGSQQAKAYYLELVPVDINGQSIFYLDIVFNADAEGNMLGNYGFDLYYDNTELTWNQLNTVWSPPPPLSTLFPPFEREMNPGLIQGISGLMLLSGGGPAEITDSLTLATIAFDIEILSSDSNVDIWFDIHSIGKGFNIDGNVVSMSSMPVSGEGLDVSAPLIPEPASSLLFIAGASALALRYFRGNK